MKYEGIMDEWVLPGDRFSIKMKPTDNEIYIVALVDFGHACLIHLGTGMRFNDIRPVNFKSEKSAKFKLGDLFMNVKRASGSYVIRRVDIKSIVKEIIEQLRVL